MILLLVACGGGPAEETLLTHLQVIAAVAEPPELAPGEATALLPTIADPEGVAPEVAMWTCTNLGEGCLEVALPGYGVSVGSVEGFTHPYAPPAQLSAAFEDPTLVLPVPAWTLACAPGACPLFGLLRSASEADSDATNVAIGELLLDPTTMLADVPLEDVSLALTMVGVSVRPVEERVINPVLTEIPELPVGPDPAEVVSLAFGVEAPQAVEACGYATAGGFTEASVVVDGGGVALDVVAPEIASGETEVYVVFAGDSGGMAVWTGAW